MKTMKKILAVLIAVVLAFSIGSVAFAEELSVEPAQENGKIYISAKSDYIKIGEAGTYDVPVSIISDWDCGLEEGVLFVSFAVGVACTNNKDYAKITNVTLDSSITADPSFSLGVAEVDESTGNAKVSFATKDLSLLKTERTEIATVEVTVDDTFRGYNVKDDELEETVQVLPILGQVFPWELALDGAYDKYTDEGYYGDFVNATFDGSEAVYVVNEDDFTGVVPADGAVVDALANCTAKPYEPTWQERLVVVLKNWAHAILDFLGSVNDILGGLIDQI